MPLAHSRRSRSLALALCLMGVPTVARADARADEKAILAAAKLAESKFALELCSYGFIQYDKSQPVSTFALFRDGKDKDSISLTHALFQSGGKTWNLTLEPGGLYGTTCTGTGDVPKPPLRAQQVTTLPINEIDEGRTSTLALTIYDRQLVYTDEEGRKPDPPSDQNWEKLRYVYQGSEDDPGGHHEYGVVLVLPKGSPARNSVPKLATFLVRGERQTPSDADLDVTAELAGDTVALSVAVTDDKDVPLPSPTASDADLLRSDHLELWYQHGPLDKDVRQLAVARLPDGKVHARWLYPRKVVAPLPKVSSAGPGKFTLQFPAAALFHQDRFFAGSAYQGGFAAVFSDTDDPKKRQETVVASSTLKWGKPETFGKIVWFPNGARFPPFPEGSRVKLEVTEQK